MREEDRIYIEINTFSLIKLYVEAYLVEEEKGFKTIQERKDRLKKLKSSIYEAIDEASEDFGVDSKEIVAIMKTSIREELQNSEKREKNAEEFAILEDILENIPNISQKEEQQK